MPSSSAVMVVGVLWLTACASDPKPDRAAEPVPAAPPAATSPSASASPTLAPSPSGAAPTPSGAASAGAPSNHLALAHLELWNARGETLVLEPNGLVTLRERNTQLGTLDAEGRFLAPDGSLVARLDPDGQIFANGTRRMPVTVTEAGQIRPENGQAIYFGTDGRLEGGNPQAPETRVRGMTEATRRTAAFLLVLAGFPRRR